MGKDMILRTAANTLPLLRGASGFWLANKLKETPPNQRTWGLAVGVLAIGSTDKIDGMIARHIGPTATGGWLDQLGDKAFVLPVLRQLGKNEEIPMYHYQVKLGRDAGVTTLRLVASHFGQNVDALPLGKYKAAFEMTGIIMASSPISHTHPELVKQTFNFASGLNLISGADYLLSFTKSIRDTPVQKLEEVVPIMNEAFEVAA